MDAPPHHIKRPAARFDVRRVSLLLSCGAMVCAGQLLASPVPGPRQPVNPQAAWLAYSAVDGQRVFPAGTSIPDTVLRLGNSAIETTAADEIHLGFQGMLHRVLRLETLSGLPEKAHDLVVIGSENEVDAWHPALKLKKTLAPESFRLRRVVSGKETLLLVEGADARGTLYGSFALLRMIAEEQSLAHLDDAESPSAPIRWTNEWDNLDGTIERGYAGRSIFFEHGDVREDLSRASDYARLLASVGINGCSINNVNANPRVLTPGKAPQIARDRGGVSSLGRAAVRFRSP